MSRHCSYGDAPARQDDEIRDQAAYAHAERMLDRYGITYIYYHPEILLGIVPGTALAEEFYARWREADRRAGRPRDWFGRRGEPRHMDDVLRDMLEGDAWSQDIFGPGSERRYW
ncbi:MAG TPA: hypothetical protein PKY77_24485 [Phycisphaerae bacterium]|nr:hypothetical protein [Phycisphaerae bacterium]HRY70688.1 hypothetical protein [Phycisphaerae bacterium]HSA28717.1 hypothetical protein [Phycisphaerae bacterium]